MSFPSPFARAGDGAPAGAAPAAPAVPAPSLPPLATKGRRAVPWLFALLAVALVALVAYFLQALGPGASIAGMVIALLPLGAVLLAVRFIDRWEPEPRSLIVLALAWGAIAAVGIALGVDLVLRELFGAADSPAAEALHAVVQAPVVEEFAKGLGVLVIFLTARRAFDGPVDGIVYGALIAAGFAFTENIQYFAVSMIEGGAQQLTTTFILRGILSPFAHVMFASITGFAVGLAARRGAAARDVVATWMLGMAGAALLHALWNGSALFLDFFGLYVTLQVPLFVLFILGILLLRREERRLTRKRLGEYAAAGWFTVAEVDMLATPRGRRAALAWARTLRGDRTAVMKDFIADAAALAAVRQRMATGRDPGAAADQQALLARTHAARQALFAP
ncbi:PrsW family intramembrane metalloprotease [Microbacterium sp. SYP-A9085]|uniref:PrsW family intramembrane metalloprotease n=1 Tax=Microbacterium sp. SYP-A9085 TaxID=2664454 RepID=UPI00129B73FC|nr:PrsW family intramembrane metalloprotease [Microbacterium sp. SYP-A9085]MRH29281.1 PrsW family intramembrane metalloprotease [Microbacterium sp. SYP-A9085]